MKTDTHACTGTLAAINLVFDMNLTVAEQHLLQAKHESEKPATLEIILLFIYSYSKGFRGKKEQQKKRNMRKSGG